MFDPSPGDAFFSLHPIPAGRPYLRRNVRKVVRYYTMGSWFSSGKPNQGDALRHERMASDDEGENPAKRQKVHHNSESSRYNSELRRPLSRVTGGNACSTRNTYEIPPASFYGRLKSDIPPVVPILPAKQETEIMRNTQFSINDIIPKEPHFFHESLRVDGIELTCALKNDDVDIDLFEDGELPFDIKCTCTAAIFYAKNDQKPGEVGWNDFMEISRHNQYCILRIDQRHDGSISRKILLPEPFIFRPEDFYVNRKRRKEDGRFLSGKDRIHTFGFADKYNLHIFIEHRESAGIWPPIAIDAETNTSDDKDSHLISEALEKGSIDKDDLQLFTNIRIFSDPPMQTIRRTILQVNHRNTRQKLPYTLKSRLDWTLPSIHTKVNLKCQKGESRINSISKFTRLIPPVSPVLMQEQASISESPADERTQRKRANVPTYNLKALSAYAQGKSPRKSNLPLSKSEQRTLDRGEGGIKYTFQQEQFSEGNKFETTVLGLGCIMCGSRSISLADLRLHLRTDHSAFKFVMRRKDSSITFNLEVIKHPGVQPNLDAVLQMTFEMRKPNPRSILNLEAFLEGNETWATSRQRLRNDRWPELNLRDDSSTSSSTNASRQSSPNTSADYDYLEKSNPKPPSGRKVFYVPRTARPTYDSNTKQPLQAGDMLPEDDGECDETWLHHRKHDLLNEFEDVNEEEKEYLRLWNLWLVDENLTSDKYLAQAVVRFAETNKVWITETKSHTTGFMRHLEALRLRGVCDSVSVDKCIWILKGVEKASTKGKERESGVAVKQQTVKPEPGKQRKAGICKCGEMPRPNDKIICRGTVSVKLFPLVKRC